MALKHLIVVLGVLGRLVSSSGNECSSDIQDEQTGSALLQKAHSVSAHQNHADHSGAARPGAARMGYKTFKGEFHTPLAFAGNIVELLRKPECRNFYATAGEWHHPPSRTIVDHSSRLFRPSAELVLHTDISAAEPSLPKAWFARVATYEDLAFPANFSSKNVTGTSGTAADFAKNDHCEMFAIRTPQRPVQVASWSRTAMNTTFVMPTLWKTGRSTVSDMLAQAAREGAVDHVRGFDASSSNENWPRDPLLQSERHTTFHQDAVDAEVKVALVRSPLDRFLASVSEDGAWKPCIVNGTGGQVCAAQVAAAKTMAQRLARDFPHSFRSCEHPSQMYFLSGTDLGGNPFVWDKVLRAEDHAFGDLQKMIGFTGRAQKPSADEKVKDKYFKAVFSDLETACSVCKVYAQDFECLGYEKPAGCTPEQCEKVGVSLP